MGTRAWEAVLHPAGAPAHDAELGAILRSADTLRTVLWETGAAEQTVMKRRSWTREERMQSVMIND